MKDIFGTCKCADDDNDLVVQNCLVRSHCPRYGGPNENGEDLPSVPSFSMHAAREPKLHSDAYPENIWSEKVKSAGLADMELKNRNTENAFLSGTSEAESSEPGSPSSDVIYMMDDIMNIHGDILAEYGSKVTHVKGDFYNVNHRKVQISCTPAGAKWQHLSGKIGSSLAKMASVLIVHDGPLHQPLFDYLLQTGLNEAYDSRGTLNSFALTGVAKNLEFAVPAEADIYKASDGDRLEAMGHAKAQADARKRVSLDSVVVPSFESRNGATGNEKSVKVRNGPSRHARGHGSNGPGRAAAMGGA